MNSESLQQMLLARANLVNHPMQLLLKQDTVSISVLGTYSQKLIFTSNGVNYEPEVFYIFSTTKDQDTSE
jgi:hypothetical protein